MPSELQDRGQIIAEIQRCANEIGRPPGRRVFEQRTGIREHDWLGVYSVRWGDALAEAGLGENEWNGPTSETRLLDALAEAVRGLGHFPTFAELQLYRRQHPSFPSPNVFQKLGTKPQRLARLVDHCAADEAMADVHAICLREVPAQTAEPGAVPEAQVSGTDRLESVYLFRSGKNFKLGRSNDVGRRFSEVGLLLPEPLVMVHSFQTDDAPGIELYWHRRFKDKRLRGEWFALTAEDVNAFKRRRSFM